jgi:hypothetical protein
MSSPDSELALIAYRTWLHEHPGGHAEMSRLLGGQPSDEALRQFEQGGTRAPRYLARLLRIIEGKDEQPDLVEEAEAALRLVREAEAAMLRVTERLRQMPRAPDVSAAIAAADAPMPTPRTGAKPVRKRSGGAG